MQLSDNLRNELLFWLHISVIAFALMSGLFLPIYIVLFLVVLHRIQIHVLQGACIFTLFKKRLKAMPRDLNFLQYAARRLFRKEINSYQSAVVDYSLSIVTVTVALASSSLSQL